MAASRLEKIGTIYTRTAGLIRSGALSWEDRPLWFDVYEAFPPKEEPRFDRPVPNMQLRQIFYKEDKIRAIFHRNNKKIGTVNLMNNSNKSLTQHFIDTYKKVEEQYSEPVNEEQLYKETVDILNKERNVKKEATAVGEEDAVSLSSAFKAARSASEKANKDGRLSVKVKDIFKD